MTKNSLPKTIGDDGELAWDPKAVLGRVGERAVRTYVRSCV